MDSASHAMYYPQHISTAQTHSPQTLSSSGTMNHYSHQQPPVLSSGPTYSSSPMPYHSQYYSNGMTSPPSNSHSISSSHSLPAMTSIPPQDYEFDLTGQKTPNGMKPRVTATLWEDEGSLCFQVEAKGICVARREDNQMINGTKLLNVAGMTRGRRDGILKIEKTRHVVKIGPMHLKGVWIPFERALEFANKEKITELLFPLFVHNINALIYNPSMAHAAGAQSRVNQAIAAAERRRVQQIRNATQQQHLPPLGTSHYSMTTPLATPEHSTLPSHGVMSRPNLERAHTLPTPPTSAMGGAPDGFSWGPTQPSNSLVAESSIGETSARSSPNTPVASPPGTAMQTMPSMPRIQSMQSMQTPQPMQPLQVMQSMQPYPQSVHEYDSSRPMYGSTGPHQSLYEGSTSHGPDRSVYAQPRPSPYVKSEICPNYVKTEAESRSNRASARGSVEQQQDEAKPANGIIHRDHSAQPVDRPGGDEHDQEQETEYTHNSDPFDGAHPSYNYSTTPAVGQLSVEHSHVATENTGSPGHQPGSGRATPRTALPPQSYYGSQTGYNTPPRVSPQSSNLYSVMSNERESSDGSASSDVYASPTDPNGGTGNGYPTRGQTANGVAAVGGTKRSRDSDDLDCGHGGTNSGSLDIKRRKTLEPGLAPKGFDSSNLLMSTTVNAPRGRR